MDKVRHITRLSGTIFSTAPYRDIFRTGTSARLESTLVEVGDALDVEGRRRDVIDQAWNWLLRNRRDDAALRGLFMSRSTANPLLPSGNDFAFELRLGGALIDFAFLGVGSEEGVEIKSIYDSATRLDTQMREYRRVIPRISLVGDARDAPRMRGLARMHATGLLLLDGGRGTWNLRRELLAPVHEGDLDVRAILGSLRAAEVEALSTALLGRSLAVPRSKLYPATAEALSGTRRQDVMRLALRFVAERRRLSARQLVRTVPASLRAIVATIDPPQSALSDLDAWLDVEV